MRKLVQALGILVLRRDADDSFRVEGEPPPWLPRLFPGAAGEGPFPVAERFPFLESFLPNARGYWGARKEGRVRSGYWVETDPAGGEVPLQASAVHVAGCDYLVVENVTSVFRQEAGVLQKARENALALERAESLGRSHRALLGALAGRVFRVRAGEVVEGGALPDALAREVRCAGASLRSAGDSESFPWGRAVAISAGEFWAILRE